MDMFQNLCNNEVATELKLGEKTCDTIYSGYHPLQV